ncbi:MAG: sigma-70 family RNA polymerase sigma factor [Nanoarchaeota archaeon]
MCEENIKKLENILFDITVDDKNKYNELFKNNIIKKLIKREANSFAQKTPIELDDIKNVCRIIIFKDLKDKNKGFKVRNKNNLALDFLARMSMIMQDRLYGNYRLMDDRKESNLEVSLESIKVPLEKLEDNYVDNTFEEELISKKYMEKFMKKLSNREKQVFVLRYEKDYTQEKIGNKLNLAQSTINNYQKRIWNKFKKYVVNF